MANVCQPMNFVMQLYRAEMEVMSPEELVEREIEAESLLGIVHSGVEMEDVDLMPLLAVEGMDVVIIRTKKIVLSVVSSLLFNIPYQKCIKFYKKYL